MGNTRGLTFFVVGLVAVSIFGGACLSKYGSSVFFAFDSASYMATANAMLRHPTGFYYTVDFLQSFGNLYWPINFSWLPEFRFAFIDNLIQPVSAYLIIGLLLYSTSFAFILAFDFGPRIALAGALAIELLTMPFLYPHGYYYSWAGPNWLPMLYGWAGLVALFAWIGRGNWIWSILGVAGFLAATIWTVGTLTKVCFVIAAAAVPFGTALLFAAQDWRERWWKVAALLLILVVLALGPIEFVRGIFAYTTNALLLPGVRAGAVGDIRSLLAVMIDVRLSNQLELARQVAGLPILVTGFLAALLLITLPRISSRVRAFGWATIAGLVGVISFFYGTVLLAIIELPLVVCVVAATGYLFSFFSIRLSQYKIQWINFQLLETTVGMASAICIVGTSLVWLSWRSPAPGGFPYPPTQPPLMHQLANDIRFDVDDPFRGRLLSLAERKPAPNSAENTVVYQAIESAQTLGIRVGNDFSYSGPAYFSVPTAQEHNRLATPSELAFVSMLLTAPGALQIPDHRLISRLDPRMLAAAGVSRVLMDQSAPAPPSFDLVDDDSKNALRLYRVPNSNLGGYSPLSTVVAANASTALETLAASQFDPKESIVIGEPVEGPFVAATQSKVTRTVDGLLVTARSAGRSMLLLPFEYTHCMKLNVSAGDPQARLMRADVMFTALSFSQEINATISIRYGPFTRAHCRLDDAAETAAWGLTYEPFLAFRQKYAPFFTFARLN